MTYAISPSSHLSGFVKESINIETQQKTQMIPPGEDIAEITKAIPNLGRSEKKIIKLKLLHKGDNNKLELGTSENTVQEVYENFQGKIQKQSSPESESKKEEKLILQKELEAKLFNAILLPTVSSLRSCIKSLPGDNVANFLSWILDKKNPFFENYVQITSITNTAKLELFQFSKILNRDVLLQVLSKLGPLNAYFFTEVFSDHLAMGLANPLLEGCEDYKSKQEALSEFNEIMIEMLNQRPFKELTGQNLKDFSIYQQSLEPKEMKEIVEAYATQYQNANANIQHDIEHSFLPMLKLNIESCRVLLQSLKESKLYDLFHEGLIARYSGSNKLLQNYKTLSLDESLEIGKQSILVSPTLAYCIAVRDQVESNPKLVDAIQDHSLKTALDKAALLVRLLNDVGTIPLSNPTQLLEKLKAWIELNQNGENFLTTLRNASKEQLRIVSEDGWSRIVKDLRFGEYNVALDSVQEVDASEAWQKFESNVLYLSNVFQAQKKELLEAVEVVNEKIKDAIPGQLIVNFVFFHEKLYSKNAMTKEGEYAI